MSFNLDDPLADILSDGSDDSFFDDDILGKKKPAKKVEAQTLQKKNELFDLVEDKPSAKQNTLEKKNSLFNLDEDKPQDVYRTRIKAPSPAPFRRAQSKEFIQETSSKEPQRKFEPEKSPGKTASTMDKFDFLDEFKEPKKELKKPLEKGKSSQSLLDDILGETPKTKVSAGPKPLTTTKTQEFDLDTIFAKGDSKNVQQSNDLKVKEKRATNKNPDTKKSKKSSDDWLGLFKDDEIIEDSGMPAWLAGDTSKKKTVEATDGKSNEPIKESEPVTQKVPQPIINETIQPLTSGVPNVAIRASNEDITTAGAALYLQQQESQLMVAMQLKAQEERLADMQRRQEESARVHREAAKASQEQVESMLARQAEQRKQMQEVIAAHQERITQRIKAMLGPPISEDETEVTVEHQDQTAKVRETPHAKEKKQLLQLVQSLQENHDKEIDLMETSYRRQLAFLEVSLHQAEERMKEESEKITKYYAEKLLWLEQHHNLYKKHTEENLDYLAERNKNDNEILQKQHLENVRILQEHHVALMENIRNAVKNEQSLIKDSATFSANLVELVADVKESKAFCGELATKFKHIAETCNHELESSIQVRDKQVSEMLQQIKKEKEAFEIEKTENRNVIQSLESRLKQITMIMEEETASMKQKRMEFEFEKATFAKQTEFAKNLLKRQDEEIRNMREEIEKEYNEKNKRIEEEKAKAQKDSLLVCKEKTAVQNIKQDLEKMKAELQMQLEEVYDEKSRLSLEKQQMHMEEQRISAKNRDLELLAKAAMEKQTQADKKLAEAEVIQQKYEERIRRIQEHVVSLNDREKQIAREKVALSRERLNIHTERKQLEGLQQCSLCKTSQVPMYTSFDAQKFMPVSKDYGSHIPDSLGHGLDADTFGKEYFDNDVGAHESRIENIEARTSLQSSYMDPKLMMLRLDVQKVLNNLEVKKNKELNDADNDKE